VEGFMADGFAKASSGIPAGRILRFVPRAASAVVLLSACLVLVGWWLEEAVLRSGLPGLVAMNPATAICFALAATALWLQADERDPGPVLPIARACAITIAVVALLVLAKYLLAWDVGPDQLLFRDQLTSAAVNGIPNRMAPNTAVAFLLLGLGLLLPDAEFPRGHRLGQSLALVVGLIGLLALVGYAYASTPLYDIPSYFPMALNTAVAFFVLAGGLLCARPTHGVMARFLSRSSAGILARRLLPAAIAAPVILGWLRLEGERAGLYGADFGVALMVMVTIALLTVLIWNTSSVLERAEQQRERAEQALRRAHDELELRVAERTTELVRANEKQQATIEELEVTEEELRQQNDELAQTQELLDAERQRYQDLFQLAPDGYVVTDSEGKIQEANRAAASLLDLEHAALLGQPLEGLVDETGRPALAAEFERLRLMPPASDGSSERHLHLRRGDGTTVDVILRVSVIRGARGEVCGLRSLLHDVTARRRAEEALSRSEERFRLLVDCVKDYAIILLDPQGLVASWNAGAERIKGYQADEILGRPMSTFYTPEDVTRGWPDELLRRALAEGQVVDEGWRVVKDGSRFWADVVITPINNERGELTGFAKVTRDITARMEAEEKLRRANDELRALVEASPLAIIAFDAEGKVASWHGGAERLFGWTSAEVVGRPLDHVPPDKGDELLQLRQQVLANGATLTDLETVRQRKDGSRVEVSISTARLHDPAGRLSGVVAVYSDITERRRAADERRARETAEAANRAKSQFLANMSHELRTPLNAIIGFSELLEDQAYGELNQRQHKYVTNILSSGRHLLQLINDILDLAKIEAGRLVLEVSEFTIDAALDDVQRIVEPLALAKRIAFTVESSGELPRLIADRPKLKQIFYNLVSNAIKFTPEGGKVTVAAKAVAESVRISVTDTGIGIGRQDLERIFLEFEQVDSSYARQQEGTGLGLALTRRLVELHGGRIWVESEVGHGSTFTFELPLTPSGPPPTGSHHQTTGLPDSSDQRPVVLVVEDEKAASELLAEYLSKNGYAVAHARNGVEAIDLARRLQPAAITLDILLPDTDGLEVLATLRSLPETREIPVVVVSITDNRELGFSLGAVAWLVKPVDREQFLEAVCRAMPPQARRPPTVLVVDDEPETVDFLSDLLASRGFRVLQASNGEEGVRLALEETPDAIVLDLIMPGVSGFDVVQRLREHPKTRDTRILISTVKDLSKDERAWLQGQVQKIVSKSGAEDLLRALRET
jgi:PAS domain S-box-containing protein